MLVSDEDRVLRLLWHPLHFHDGEVSSAAFDRSDLLGKADRDEVARYISVDQEARISKASVDWRIEYQTRQGLNADLLEKRKIPRFGGFLVSNLRRCTCGEDNRLFEITHEPIEANEEIGMPANPAHCGVKSLYLNRINEMSRATQNSLVERMRSELLKALDSVLEYTDVFPDRV